MLLRLLDLINSDADNQAIEVAVKRDALISLNLLRLVNSHLTGRARASASNRCREALARLGRSQLQRWLQILLYAAPGGQRRIQFAAAADGDHARQACSN